MVETRTTATLTRNDLTGTEAVLFAIAEIARFAMLTRNDLTGTEAILFAIAENATSRYARSQ